MKKINLYWFEHKEGHGNFGDELSTFIISRLTPCKINRILIPASGFDYIRRAYTILRYRNTTLRQVPKLFTQFFNHSFIAAIGSILAHLNNPHCKVWGSGIINKESIINPATFYAVRGNYTQQRLRELNLHVPSTIGDPALLLPLVYPVQKTKKYQLGIIPHVVHSKEIAKQLESQDVLVIDLTNTIEQVIEQINSCEHIISTSLHGIIVSQAYGIPSLWYIYNSKKLFGDNIKFYDYFSSVGIEEYTPFELNLATFDYKEAIAKVEKNQHLTLIKKELHTIQTDLIDAAPFSVIDKYKTKEK